MQRGEIVDDLVCPQCRTGLSDEMDTAADGSLGTLKCSSCDNRYSVADGVFYLMDDLEDQERTSQTFGYQWTGFWKGKFDRNEIFGLKIDESLDNFCHSVGLSPAELAGRKILDAGTASGRIPLALRDVDCSVYGADIHSALASVAVQLSEAENVAFFNCDLLRLPFRDETFDVIWCSGVLHHTPDTRTGFDSIAKAVKPGGRLFVWLYGKELNHYRMFRRLLPFAHRLPTSMVYLLAAVIAAPLYMGFNAFLTLLRLAKRGKSLPYHVLGITIENPEPKTYGAILLHLFDQLHPRYQREHSVEEVTRRSLASGPRRAARAPGSLDGIRPPQILRCPR